MAAIDPFYSWVELLRLCPTVTTLVPADRIVLDLQQVDVPVLKNWLVVTPTVMRTSEIRAWVVDTRITAFATYPHVAQQIIEAVLTDLWDTELHFTMHHLSSGPQAGAVICVNGVGNLTRDTWQFSGDQGYPYRAVDLSNTVSEEAMSWAS